MKTSKRLLAVLLSVLLILPSFALHFASAEGEVPDNYVLISAEEKTSAEGHDLQALFTAASPIDLTAYAGRELSIAYKIKLSKTANFTSTASDAEWIRYMQNGRMEINGTNAVTSMHGTLGVYADLRTADVYTDVIVPFSGYDTLESVKVQLWNDTATAGGNNDNGVIMTVKDVYLVVGEAPPIARWSNKSFYTNVLYGWLIYSDWGATVDGGSVDLSDDSDDNVANPNYAFTMQVKVDPAEGLTLDDLLADAFGNLDFHLRTAGGAGEANWYNVKAEEMSWDGNVLTVVSPLANITPAGADFRWDNVVGLNVRWAIKDGSSYRNDGDGQPFKGGNVTLMNCKVIDLTQQPEPEPEPEPQPTVDKTALDAAITQVLEQATTIDTSLYTDESVAALQSALTDAQTVSAKADATQDEVDAALAALVAAGQGLTLKDPDAGVDKSLLQQAITAAETMGATLNQDDYTAESWQAAQDALDAAKAAMANEDATQEEVDAARDALIAAGEGLTLKPAPVPEADKTALTEAVERAEAIDFSEYTAGSAALAQSALETAKTVLADAAATQEDVDAAADALDAAIDGLTPSLTVIWLPYADGTRGEGASFTCPEAHGLWVRTLTYDVDEFGTALPLYLQPYVGCDLTFKFEMKLNKTENFPAELNDMPEADWLKNIHNGSMILFTDVEDSPNSIKWTGEAGDSPFRFGPTEPGNIVENLNADDFIEVEFPVPDTIIDAGQLMQYGVLIYNDLHNLGYDNDKGITMTVRNLRLEIDASNMVDKASLEAAIAKEKSDEELAGYTAESVAAYKALFDAARAVLEDPDATTADVVDQIKALQAADAVLVEDIAAGGTITLVDEPKNSGEKHYLNVVHTFNPPLDLAKYGKRDSYQLTFDMMLEATDSLPAEYAEGNAWLQYIVNGTVNLWTTDLGESKISMNTLEGDEKIVLNALQDQLADIEPGVYTTITVPVPQAVVDAGVISQIEVFVYNDIPENQESGVTMTATNFQLTLGEVVEEPEQLEGDVDNDGAVTAADALMALQAATDKIDLNAAQEAAADVDDNGEVSAADALAILQFATEKIDTFTKVPA